MGGSSGEVIAVIQGRGPEEVDAFYAYQDLISASLQ